MLMKDCRTQEARRQKAKLQKRAEIANRCSYNYDIFDENVPDDEDHVNRN